jgi:RHS repeat-associated protein
VKQTVAPTTTVFIGNYCEIAISGTQRITTTYYYANGQRIAMRTSAGVTYIHSDHLRSTSVTSGAQSGDIKYFPYGATRSGAVATTYKFTGQRLDDSTGLYYYGARYYDAALGRFIQADSIVPQPGNPQALNRYSYTLNNPLKYTDPDGHCPWWLTPYLAYEAINFATQLRTWRGVSAALSATSESSPVLQPLTIAASTLMIAPYERDIQQAATGQGVPSDILGAAIRLQALGSNTDFLATKPELAGLSGGVQHASVGIGQITLVEAQKFRNLGLIDFDPTLQNIQDPQRSIQLMAAKIKTVDMYLNEKGGPIREADRRQLLMIGQNEGTGIVDLYIACGGNWELIFEKNRWARFQLEAMQRRMAE